MTKQKTEANRIDWLSRWSDGQIGFHQSEYHPRLTQFWSEVSEQSDKGVFVPLCGKSHDMQWLYEQGHPVTGCELSDIAIEAFYESSQLTPSCQQHQHYKLWEAESFRIFEGDIFKLPNNLLSSQLYYDRAALMALPPETRRNYVSNLIRIAPDLQRGLLITVEYDASLYNGTPFSVPEVEIHELFTPWFEVELKERSRLEATPKARQAGVHCFYEVVYVLKRRSAENEVYRHISEYDGKDSY